MSNSYEFTTVYLGPPAYIEGTFHPGEKPTLNCPGEAPSFEIDIITIDGEELEIGCLTDQALLDIQIEAFDKMADDAEDEDCRA